jgi:hypothetical protein
MALILDFRLEQEHNLCRRQSKITQRFAERAKFPKTTYFYSHIIFSQTPPPPKKKLKNKKILFTKEKIVLFRYVKKHMCILFNRKHNNIINARNIRKRYKKNVLYILLTLFHFIFGCIFAYLI